MTTEINTPIPGRSISKRSPDYAAHLLQALSIAAVATLLIVLVFYSLGRFRLSETTRELLIAFIYCTLISLPSMALLTWISRRYSERFPRLVVLMQAAAQVRRGRRMLSGRTRSADSWNLQSRSVLE